MLGSDVTNKSFHSDIHSSKKQNKFLVPIINTKLFFVAPAMHPLRKVMSRIPHKVLDDQFHVGFKESPEFVIEDRKHDNNNVHQSISFGGFVINDNMADPTSKSTFPQGAADKVKSFHSIQRSS
jgi:hypothetical protein